MYNPLQLNQELNQTICQIFPHRWNWILKKEAQSWRTIKTPLRDESLIKIFSDSTQIVGVGFGQYSQYIMLDIDKNSPYHPNNDRKAIIKLEFALSKIGLIENIKIQSSNSDGLHIYYPIKVKIKSYQLGKKITEYLEAEGWTVKNGILEVFPNKKKGNYSHNKEEWTVYQRHRLPLQPDSGSYLLDDKYQVIRQQWCLGLEEFVTKWRQIESRQPIEQLKTYLYGKINSSSKLKIISRELEAQIARGFTNAGETNDILLELGRRVRIVEKLGGIDLKDKLIEIVTSMSGYKEYCGHQQEIIERCQDVARWAQKHFWVKNERKKQDLPLPKTNNKYKQEEAKIRISRALEQALDKTFFTITEFTLWMVKTAKCSLKTLYKYQKQWRGIVEKMISLESGKQGVENKEQSETRELGFGSSEQLESGKQGVESKEQSETRELGFGNSEQGINNTEKNKIVCNKPEQKEQSLIYKNNTKIEKKQLETRQDKEQSQLDLETTKISESVGKPPADKDLSLFNLDQYILRLYILSLFKPQGYEVKKEQETCGYESKQSESQEKDSSYKSKQSESQEEKLDKQTQQWLKSKEIVLGEGSQQATGNKQQGISKNSNCDLVKYSKGECNNDNLQDVIINEQSQHLGIEDKSLQSSLEQAGKEKCQQEKENQVSGQKNSKARTRFIEELKEKWGELPSKLINLILKAEAQHLENCTQLLEKNSKIGNPIGFVIKALENNWQAKKSSSVKTAKANLSTKTASNQPSWYSEFEKFYQLAIATGYCQDCPAHWLPTNHRHEPMVRLTQPNEYLRIPYTLMYWRTAKEEFESLYPHLSIENWSAET
ncbi:hypothetical protein [Geminocystis sp. NIES-3709]|uniref:hypothetical protein n=1 Tax=Geminocystis sp. NIES-3709 TaxID=1617448 RepID=UPI0005FC6D0D|nr:hypothetical protein [Geminocystis sp. NIES-3709]BAQ66977.1 hypothetical protein GM3709_3742 [Geminocystis sp. NIES-3709]